MGGLSLATQCDQLIKLEAHIHLLATIVQTTKSASRPTNHDSRRTPQPFRAIYAVIPF